MYGNTTTYTYDKLLRLTSYVSQAGDDYTYFSIENCGQIQSQYGFDDNDMFMFLKYIKTIIQMRLNLIMVIE